MSGEVTVRGVDMTMWVIAILKALLTPVVACITTYIAVRQWRDNHLKLKMENYDRCLGVYQEVVKILKEGQPRFCSRMG